MQLLGWNLKKHCQSEKAKKITENWKPHRVQVVGCNSNRRAYVERNYGVRILHSRRTALSPYDTYGPIRV